MGSRLFQHFHLLAFSKLRSYWAQHNQKNFEDNVRHVSPVISKMQKNPTFGERID